MIKSDGTYTGMDIEQEMVSHRRSDGRLWAEYGYENDLSVPDLQKRIDDFYESRSTSRGGPVDERQPDDGKWAWFAVPLAFLLAIGAWVLLGMVAEWLLPR